MTTSIDKLPNHNAPAVIVAGGYLARSATLSGSTLNVVVDFNKTTDVEIIGVPAAAKEVTLNGVAISGAKRTGDVVSFAAPYRSPKLSPPDLHATNWLRVSSTPELSSTYSDAAWRSASLSYTNNTAAPALAPGQPSLYASDYGFHTGALVYRAHFTAAGGETKVTLETQGGNAFVTTVYLDDVFLGSWTGTDKASSIKKDYAFPSSLAAGKKYTLTAYIDTNGLNQNWVVMADEMKFPRGVLSAQLTGGTAAAAKLDWKLTGNLGGEDYADRDRGPLNEGGLWVERQGLHLPGSPWKASFGATEGSSPFEGLSAPGIVAYGANVPLNLPNDEFDIPVSFVFVNATSDAAAKPYRAVLYVNGWQFGKYASNVGPQTEYPVPEGILNYKGDNWVVVVLWALEAGGAKVPDLFVKIATPVVTGRNKVELVKAAGWSERKGAY